MLIKAFEKDVDAMMARGDISKINRGELRFDDMFPKIQGIRSTKLVSAEDQAKYGTEGFIASLSKGMVLETPVQRTKHHRAFVEAATTSGTIKQLCDDKTTPHQMPMGNISHANSRKFMRLKRCHMGLIHNSDIVHLPGIVDPLYAVRSAWRDEGEK